MEMILILVIVIIIVYFFIWLLTWSPPPPRWGKCEGKFQHWCHLCITANWSSKIELQSEIVECLIKYFDVSLPRTMNCYTLKSECKQFGVE